MSWTRFTNAINTSWTSITCNSIGDKLACVSDSTIYYSIDSGNTWYESTSEDSTFFNQKWSKITSNSTGDKLVACAYEGYIWYSIDYGVTWVKSSSLKQSWSSITSNSIGDKLAACANDDYIYLSIDGLTWTKSPDSTLQKLRWSDLHLIQVEIF